jgi:SlyX protein
MDCVSAEPSIAAMSSVKNPNDPKTLDDRVDTLEARLTFQEDAIETLNKTITEQWARIDRLTRQLVHLNERLREAEAQAPGAANEPPPHY